MNELSQKKNPEVRPESEVVLGNEVDLEDEALHEDDLGNVVGLESEVEVDEELEVGLGGAVDPDVDPRREDQLLKWFQDGRGMSVQDWAGQLREMFEGQDRDRRSLERSSETIENAEDENDRLLPLKEIVKPESVIKRLLKDQKLPRSHKLQKNQHSFVHLPT